MKNLSDPKIIEEIAKQMANHNQKDIGKLTKEAIFAMEEHQLDPYLDSLDIDADLDDSTNIEELINKGRQFLGFSEELASGYTYIGQFISHELQPFAEPDKATQKASNHLDLNSIYGNSQEHGLLFGPDGTFKDVSTAAPDWSSNRTSDVIHSRHQNDDHVIVAQYHLFWQRLHNCLIKQGFATNTGAAKKLVVSTFQLMVIEDFLPHVCDLGVYHEIVSNNHDFLHDKALNWMDVFHYGTFRCGHSLIGHNDRLTNANDDLPPFDRLGRSVSAKGEDCSIEKNDYIDWRAFFCLQDHELYDGGMPIDTRISTLMNKIPRSKQLYPFDKLMMQNIGAEVAADLPSGMEVAKLVERVLPKSLKLRYETLGAASIDNTIFAQLGLGVDKLTVWLYVLLESQLTATNGKYGVLASCVNVHVIKQSIKQAQLSVYKYGQYDFDNVVDRLGEWGEVLKRFAAQNNNDKNRHNSKITMDDIVDYVTEYEQRAMVHAKTQEPPPNMDVNQKSMGSRAIH